MNFRRMSEQRSQTKFADVESRRSASSSRRSSVGRRLYYFLGMPVLNGLMNLLWRSYRIQAVIGADIVDRLISERIVCAPCYWHQNLILCVNFFRQWISRGFKACFLISASVDGDAPTRIAEGWGAQVIRGSANNTGALVLRDMHQAMKRGVSIVTIADGPTGPKSRFKSGVVLVARIGGIPMVPVACAADRAWYLNRWDEFMIPKPFSRVVLAVGEPVPVPRGASPEEMERLRETMENAVNSLVEQSKRELERPGSP